MKAYPEGEALAEKQVFIANHYTHRLGIQAKNQIVPGNKTIMKVKIKSNNGKRIKLYPNKIFGGFKVQPIGKTSATDSNKEDRLNHNV